MASPIEGKKIVFTGKMESGDRDDMKARARELGADVDTSVSGNTDILVHGVQSAHNSKSTKIRRAEELGVTILDENAYLALIADAS